MKPHLLKRIIILFLFLLPIFSSAVYAQNLNVTGITNPAAANGRYLPNGTLYGHDSWKHESQHYYIYYDIWTDSNYYWNIDVDTDDADSLFYSEANPLSDSPVNVVNWNSLSGAGSPLVVEEGVPEINVKGNNKTITDGTTALSFSDHTQFGSADVSSGTATRTYTIENTGPVTLTITGVTIGGTHSSNFSVTTSPAASVASSGTTTFMITFNPSTVGNRTATVSIANNDSNENPYTFNIQGYGFTPKDLLVSGITNPAAANGNYIHQGLMFNFEYWKHETLNYYLFNDDFGGTRYWNVDVDTDDSDTDYLFYISSEAGSPVGLTNWTKNIGITGDPSITEGIPVPEINVQGNGVTIPDDDILPSMADHTNFGSLEISSGIRARTFTIQNTGGAALNLSGSSPYVTLSGAAASDFSVTTPPSATIAASGSTTFVVTFDPSAAGTRTATLSIANDDSDENPYNFTIQGDGFTPKNLIVSGITTPAAANGIYTHQGILNEFQYWRHESGGYYIYNDEFSGSRYWNIDTDTDDTASNFYSNNHNEDASPVNVTSWQAETGNAGTPLIVYAGPEIRIKGNSVEIVDGDVSPDTTDHTDFGSADIATGSVVRTFTIENLGVVTLSLTDLSPYAVITGATSDFSLTQIPANSMAVSSSTTFQVTFNPTSTGLRSATISIANNDGDENPYNFSIQGTGTAAPEMDVSGNGTSIADGDVVPSVADDTDFGNVDITSGSVEHTFTITNTGSGSLNLSDASPYVIITGHTSDFSLTQTPSNSIAAGGGTTTFKVTFDPTTAGTRSATIHIANNDSDKNPYHFSIQGNGIAAPSVTTSAASSVATTSATGNGNITATNGGNATVRGVIYYAYTNTDKVIGDAGVTNVSEAGNFGTGAFTASLTPLSVNTQYNARAYATSPNGTGYGGRVAFWTLANVPSAPTVNNATATTLDVTVNVNGNPTGTEFCIQETSTGKYVQADGTLGVGQVWQNAATWGTKTVTGLSAGPTYTFQVKARNGGSTETSYGQRPRIQSV